MSDRELVANLLAKLPEDASLDDIARAIEFVAGIRRAREQVRRGEVVSIEEVRRRMGTWVAQ
jgi:hypothetical protein